MKLLIVTQKVDQDDENLGFFHRWIEEFAKHSDGVAVIANSAGSYNLPDNASVFSLGKERRFGRWYRIWRFWKLFFREYRRSDAVFFHMIPEFVILAAPLLIFGKKPSALWYVHKSVTWRLKLAERLVSWVFTASELSFRLPSKKVIYTGHAIDTKTFVPSSKFQVSSSHGLRLLTVGRISPVKDIETVIRACAILKDSWDRSWSLSIVGGPLMARDREYLASLKKLVKEGGLEAYVHFEGGRPFGEVPEIYRDHDIFISMSTTGSLDKSVLEAMSSGLTVITANEAFQSLLPPQYFLEKRSPEFLAERIKTLADENRPNTQLRELVISQHSLEGTIAKILKCLEVPV